jgi:hypothetical protein
MRTDEIGEPQGELSPGLDEQLILGIERIVIRHCVSRM